MSEATGATVKLVTDLSFEDLQSTRAGLGTYANMRKAQRVRR